MIYKLQNGRTIPLGGDYLEYLQNIPETYGGSIQPSIKVESLPKKFNGSQQAARTYAEGYQKGAKPVTKAIDNAGQKIFNTTKNVAMFVPGPIGAITWLGQMGADTANGEYGKVVRDLILAAGMGAGTKAAGYIANNTIKPLIVAHNIKVKHPELIRQISSNSDHIQALIKVWNNNTGQSIQYSPKLVENARKVNSALLYGKDPILESAASLSGFNGKTLSRLGIDKNVINAIKGQNQTSKKLLAAKNLPENVTLYTSNSPKQLKYLGHGQEHEVYRDGENVIKFRFHRNPTSYSPYNSNYLTLTDEFTSTGAYRYKKQGSEFIPERKYLGVGIDDGGSLVPVFEEPFIEGKIPTQLELNEAFAKNGIKYDGVKQVTFKDGSTALDINPKNVLLVDGKPIIIDPITGSMYNPNSRYYKFKPREVIAGSRPISIAEKAGIPKGERKYLTDWTNWSKSTPISEKHLIEYSIIDNDLWRSKFKPFAGTDIRSHIQLRSKDAKKLDPRILFTGVEETINPNYNGILWTTRDGLSARAYAPSDEQVMQIVIPKDAKINTYDAKGNGWFEIDGKKLWDKGYRTNDFVNQSFDNGYDVAEIKRVVDIGPNHVPYSSKYNYFDNKLDFLERAPIQTDVIIKPGYPRKSIVGNNGDFDLSKQSLFEKRGGIIKGQNGFLNTWQKAYNSKFGKGLRDLMFGKDSDLSDEEYLEKYGYNKPVGGIGILGALVAPEWEGLEIPEITAQHIGNQGKALRWFESGNSKMLKVPIKETSKKASNWQKFLKLSQQEQDDFVRRWNGESFQGFATLKSDKQALGRFRSWINSRK